MVDQRGVKGPGQRPKLKRAFVARRTLEPAFSGGANQAAFSADAGLLYGVVGEDVVRVTDCSTGAEVASFEGDSAVTALAVAPASTESEGTLLIARRSLALSFHALPAVKDDTVARTTVARAHDAPISIAVADATGTLFATGAADGIIKVWDAAHGHCTHVFRPHATGVVSALHFDVALSRTRARLISAAEDGKVRVWNLRTRKCDHVLESHVSVVRGLAVSDDGATIVSGSRDRVVTVWDGEKGALRRTIPVLETIEAIGLIEATPAVEASRKGKGRAPEPSLLVYTAGDSGRVRLWDVATGQQVHKVDADEKAVEILDVVPLPSLSALAVVHADQNIRFHSFAALQLREREETDDRLIVGYNDEIIDTVFLAPDGDQETQIALATNSAQIRIYGLDGAFDRTQLLGGHGDVVLSLARSTDGATLISGSKDNTARIWRADEAGRWRCVGTCSGHLESVGAVSLARAVGDNGLPRFAATASQDRTIKLWDLSAVDADAEDVAVVRALVTQKAHEKDINSIDIAPNDRLLVSGSQDKTAKLFTIETAAAGGAATLTPVGTFKGHRRGVWSVKFSRTDQALATASGDKTIKLWNIHDFSCLKTFEGHTNSVLRVDFITAGLQLVSTASDGLVRVWNIRDEDCAATLDNHEEKIWALAVSGDGARLASGAGDSVLTFWDDATAEQILEKETRDEELVLKNQDYENFVAAADYRSAILLALDMDQPRRLWTLFHTVSFGAASDPTSITGSTAVDSAVETIAGDDLFRLLGFVRDWNTAAKTAEVAQTVLHAVLKTHAIDDLLTLDAGKGGKMAELLDALIPYTERHLGRVDRVLMQESSLVDFVLANFLDDDPDVDVDMAPEPVVAMPVGR